MSWTPEESGSRQSTVLTILATVSRSGSSGDVRGGLVSRKRVVPDSCVACAPVVPVLQGRFAVVNRLAPRFA